MSKVTPIEAGKKMPARSEVESRTEDIRRTVFEVQGVIVTVSKVVDAEIELDEGMRTHLWRSLEVAARMLNDIAEGLEPEILLGQEAQS